MPGTCFRRSALFTSVVLVCLALSAQAAFAGTTIYSSESPAPGSTIQITNPPISLVAVDPYGLYSSVSVKVDSTSLKARYTAFDGRITAQASGLSSGWHTVTVSTLNWAGQRNYHTWSFRVAVPPKLSTPLPGNASTVNSVRPDVSALVTLASGATVSSTEMTIDGTVVGSSYDPATRRVVWSKDRDLADERTHSVVAKVTDSNGQSATLTWSFMVQRYEDMAQPSCVTCHSQMPLAHDTSSPETCFTCHNPSDEPDTSPIGDCVDCHYWVHGPEKVTSYDCEYCHSQQWSLRVASHDEAPADYHQTTTAMDGCACHSTAITREHARRTDDMGVSLTCGTCHESTDPLVIAAIGSGDTSCNGCHGGAAHTSDHSSQLAIECQDCHAPDLPVEHDNRGLTCTTCHLSSDPVVVAAIAVGDTNCDACHVVSDHTAVHDTTVAVECADCHVSNLVTEHASRAVECAGCHESTDPIVTAAIAAQDKTCAACHGTTDHASLHETALPSVDCESCHVANLVTEHTNRAVTCAGCHSSTDPVVINAIAANDKACSTCHGSADHLAVHESGTAGTCLMCHSPNLVTEHESRAVYCAGCHESADPTVSAAIAANDLSCTACHSLAPDHGSYQPVQHTSGISSQTLTGSTPSPYVVEYSASCTACHYAELGAEHSKTSSSSSTESCAACHPAPRNTLSTWSKNCVESGCHPVATSTAQHGNMDIAHTPLVSDSDCMPCHQGIEGQTIADIHVRERGNPNACVYCHSAGSVPTIKACRTCHVGFTPDNHW